MSKSHLLSKACFTVLFCWLLIGCESGSDLPDKSGLSGEYSNAKESVIFSSDNTVIVKASYGPTGHGKFKINDGKVYIFDDEGKSFGVYVINGDTLEIDEANVLDDSLTKVGNSGGKVVDNPSDEVVGNPLFGKWKVESVQDAHGEVGLPEESKNSYWEFSPSKMVIGDRGKVITAAVLDYAVEDGRVTVTAEAEGEQQVIKMRLLEGDRVKFEMDEGTGENVIMYRVGDASSE